MDHSTKETVDVDVEKKVLDSLVRLERMRGDGRGCLETIRASHEFRNPYVVDAMAEHGNLFAFGSNLDPDRCGSGHVLEEDDHERLALAERESTSRAYVRKRTREEKDSIVPRRGRVLGRLSREEAERAVLEAKEAVFRSRSKGSDSK